MSAAAGITGAFALKLRRMGLVLALAAALSAAFFALMAAFSAFRASFSSGVSFSCFVLPFFFFFSLVPPPSPFAPFLDCIHYRIGQELRHAQPIRHGK